MHTYAKYVVSSSTQALAEMEGEAVAADGTVGGADGGAPSAAAAQLLEQRRQKEMADAEKLAEMRRQAALAKERREAERQKRQDNLERERLHMGRCDKEGAGLRDVVRRELQLAAECLHSMTASSCYGAMADLAAEANDRLENIGARRLMTIIEKVFEEVSFDADLRATRGDRGLLVDGDFVRQRIEHLVSEEDLGRFVL